MRVAALYDIHGNLPALEAVLAEVQAEGVDRIVVGGDTVPGPMPRETVSLLLGLQTPTDFIYGNGESDLLSQRDGNGMPRVPRPFHETMRWVGRQLPAEHLDEFASWPGTIALGVPQLGRVLFCHATPRDDNEIFTRLTPEERLRPLFEETGADVVVCGHTHMQFDRLVGTVRVVNAGSVGMPFGEPGAFWTLIGPEIELRHTPYDLEGTTDRIRATSYPGVPGFEILRPASEAKMLKVFEAASLQASE